MMLRELLPEAAHASQMMDGHPFWGRLQCEHAGKTGLMILIVSSILARHFTFAAPPRLPSSKWSGIWTYRLQRLFAVPPVNHAPRLAWGLEKPATWHQHA